MTHIKIGAALRKNNDDCTWQGIITMRCADNDIFNELAMQTQKRLTDIDALQAIIDDLGKVQKGIGTYIEQLKTKKHKKEMGIADDPPKSSLTQRIEALQREAEELKRQLNGEGEA